MRHADRRGLRSRLLNTKVYDEIITVTNDDAFATGKKIGKSEGVLVGMISDLDQAPRAVGSCIDILAQR